MVYRLRAEVGSFRASLAQASASTKKFGDDLLAIDAKGDKMRRGLSGIADVGGKVGLVAAGGLAAATKAAVDWESAWAGVQKTTDGTASQMAELEGQLREMARTMPATHQEIAATAEAAGQLGVAREDVAA
ncbi:phage tail tape measure protein, TP901 family, core region, partial [Pimelobacter simplex]